ncbi:ferric reductase NAD binding domain-containing protein [Bisporella sp. PMI_857]|nr:ferric reductase NAD binding domain-containing protein [Bisporella sp. PMI_857]
MSMGVGVPGLFHMQNVFWAFIGTAIGVATLVNLFNQILYRQRLAALRTTPLAAKPRNFVFQAQATAAAVIREYSYYSIPVAFRKWRIHLPPMGLITMMVGYILLITVACLYRLDPDDFLQWEDIGYRSGFIAVCQIPLIVLLSGKRNIIGFFTGVSYERLNWLHRWTARALLFTVLIHMGYWMTSWAKYDYILVKIKTDAITQKGLAAGSVLAWLVLSSMTPFRGWSYEFFVIQHLISWLGFLAAAYLHVNREDRMWIWMPLGFWAFDRVVRAGYLFYNNLALFHRGSSGILACRASFEPLDESHTRITIANPPVSWTAGQHMFVACHPLAPLASHPFTIASIPEDGKMEFIVRAKKGATKKFFSYANRAFSGLPTVSPRKEDRGVLIEGPYASVRPFRQFDSVVFVAGSTGATFTVPLLRDIVHNWKNAEGPKSKVSLKPAPGAVTRHIRFIWCLKYRTSISWFRAQLDRVISDLEALRNQGRDVNVDITIYITCDDELTSPKSSNAGDGPRPQAALQRDSEDVDEKTGKTSTLQVVRSRPSSIQECCCCNTIVEEDDDAVRPPCSCSTTDKNATINKRPSSSSHERVSSSSSLLHASEKPSLLVDSRIHILSGRPNIKGIVRKTAEQALGEMAIVVCGPKGMVQATRNAAVAVSDERAVHKGTGAQGIYVHAEAFGYA